MEIQDYNFGGNVHETGQRQINPLGGSHSVFEPGCIGSVTGWRSDRLSGLSCQNTPEESWPWAPADRPSLLLPLLVPGLWCWVGLLGGGGGGLWPGVSFELCVLVLAGGLGALTGPGLASLLGSGGPPASSSSSR